MKRSGRSCFTLPGAASAILGAWAILTASQAGAQSRPASAEAERGETFQFRLPYDGDKAYTLQQTVRLEGRTGEYRPDDLVVDIRQVLTATVRRDANAPGVLAARIVRIVQRGGESGRHHQVDSVTLEEPPAGDLSDDAWHRMPFQADLDGSGKLSNPRGSAQATKNKDPQFLNHPTVVSRLVFRGGPAHPGLPRELGYLSR